METPMIFNKLTIERSRWGDDKGEFTGEVSFSSDNSRVSLKVTPEMTAKILDMCADQLMETAHGMSEIMRGDIIEGLPLENRKQLK